METIKIEVTNTLEVGQQITKSDYKTLVKNYTDQYPNTNATFIIKSSLIEEVLKIDLKVAGIRFMYGLKDELNPNSLVLFLIPCVSLSDANILTQAILVENGYLDHNGDCYTIEQISEMMSWHVKSMNKRNSELVYKETTRGNLYGKSTLVGLMGTNVAFIQYDLGLRGDVIAPTIHALNEDLEPFNEIYMDFTQPCPSVCYLDKEEDICLATLAVDSNSSDKTELDFYRAFRDNNLLELEGGASLYEMNYFKSPIIKQIISKNDNSEAQIRTFYNSEIKPFKELLENEDYQEAVYSLKETLYSLFSEYTLDKVTL